MAAEEIMRRHVGDSSFLFKCKTNENDVETDRKVDEVDINGEKVSEEQQINAQPPSTSLQIHTGNQKRQRLHVKGVQSNEIFE